MIEIEKFNSFLAKNTYSTSDVFLFPCIDIHQHLDLVVLVMNQGPKPVLDQVLHPNLGCDHLTGSNCALKRVSSLNIGVMQTREKKFLTFLEMFNHRLEVLRLVAEDRFVGTLLPRHPIRVEGNLLLPYGDVYDGSLCPDNAECTLDTSREK